MEKQYLVYIEKILKPYINLNILVMLSLTFSVLHFFYPIHGFTFETLINFQGNNPFQARFLTYLPLHILSGYVELNDNFFTLYFIFVTAISFIIIFIYANKIFEKKTYFPNIFLLVLLYLIFFTYLYHAHYRYFYSYDIVSIAFITFLISKFHCDGLSTKKNLILVCLAVFLATINRDTIILVIAYYFFMYFLEKKLTLVTFTNTCLMTSSWILGKFFVYSFMSAKGYSEISGSPGIYYHGEKLRVFSNFNFDKNMFNSDQIHMFCGYGYLFLLIPIMIFFKEKISPLSLVFIMHFIIYIFVGNLFEIRVYGDMFIFFLLMLANFIHANKKNII